MDALNLKACSDLSRTAFLSEDDFYENMSCNWLLGIRVFLKTTGARVKHLRQKKCHFGKASDLGRL